MTEVTHNEVWSSYHKLRNAHLYGGGTYDDAILDEAIKILEQVARKMRHDAIFKAGADTDILQPGDILFEGHPLGSMERCTFYDGHASTHPDFKNPYRQGGR